MPEPARDDAATTPQRPEGADKHRQRRLAYIMVALGAVGVMIAWLTYRRSAGAAAAQSAGAGTPGATPYTYPSMGGSNGMVPYSSADGSQASYEQALLQAVSGLGQQISSLQNTPTSSSSSLEGQNASPVPAVPSSPPASSLPGFLTGTGFDASKVSGTVVGWALQPGGGVDYATNTGAVYTEGGATYYGGTNPGSIGAGYNAGSIVGIQPLQGGGYSLVNAKGQTYNFNTPLSGR